MKIKKGNKIIHPFITGDDVIITKTSEEKGTVVTVDDVLDDHKKEIDKLKSNVKYIYSYGGVGGNGHGGSGGGSTGTPMLFVSLGGHQIQSGSDNIIVFSKPGEYVFEGSLSNAGGEIFYVYVGYGKNIKNPKQIILDKENRWIIKAENYNLKENGQITVTLKDVDGRTLSTVTQNYVVNAHNFEAKFKYVFEDREIEFSPYEYFMGNYNQGNPFIDISFSINIPNVQNVIVNYNIKGVDGRSDIQYSDSMGDITTGSGSVSYGQITNSNLRIYLSDLERNGIPFVDENNTGTYDVTITLNYSVSGSPADSTEILFKITLIPNYLYINVRNSHNVLYDNLDELLEDLSQLIEDQEFEKGIPVGSNTSFYCKVYEQAITSNKKTYDITFNSYDRDESTEEFDENPHYTVFKTAEEQVETPQPINVAFDSPGIKKLKFLTTGKKTTSTCTIIKYIYIKPNKNQIDWYSSGIDEQKVSYFRANQGTDTYNDFPQLPISNNSPLEMSETSEPLTLTHSSWSQVPNGFDTTILSFGIQYGAINNDHSEVVKVYKQNDLVVNLRSDKLFSDADNKNILLPLEKDLDASDSSKYHLVQIVRYRIGTDTSSGAGGYLYGTYLYIDGKIESDDPSTLRNSLYIDRIVLNNVNAIYNLISIQYIKMGDPSTVSTNHTSNNTIDGIIFQHYLAYKSRMNVGEVTESEKSLLTNIADIKFNGTDVIVDYNYLTTVSHNMPIPTMMLSFGSSADNETSISESEAAAFYKKLFQGYQSGNTNTFGDQEISLYWCDGMNNNVASNPISKINVPTLYDEGVSYDGTWHLKLQGTSTMKNRIKNFSLYIEKRDSDLPKSILMSPNYDPSNEHSFLPENEWTLKADIADSAHANNTAVGKFVNHTCTPFSQGLNLPTDIKPFIKNTLEGFPVLMYFRIGENIYYLGIYNFNMGRQSYYNLGYHSSQDMREMIDYIPEHSSSSFTFSLGSGTPTDNLVIAEIQENWADFDFHQYGDDVLFQDSGDPRTMFGNPKEKMTYTNIDNAKGTLREFVKSVAKGGAYCFANIGKIPQSSEGVGGSCENRYNATEEEDGTIKEYVPDLSYQFKYDQDGKRVYLPQNENTFDNIKIDIDNLLKCIHTRDKDNNAIQPRLNFTSVSEYYTICMGCGLIDSILKNMNIKSWDGITCYTAFYDMDCAFGEDNIGRENVSYLAATDYWYSPINNGGYLDPIKKKFDYWDQNVGKGFDFTSSYLFAIAKYAQAILAVEKQDLILFNYPQQFWAKLRNGELKNANYFMDNYFSSGVRIVPSYLASLNYQVKYLYYGSVIDETTGLETENRYFANESAFNGTRFEKVREWLDKRLHFLDFMFNVQGIDIPIGSTDYRIPMGDTEQRNALRNNSDVVILKDAFSTNEKNGVIIGSDGDYIGIEAPLNTPIVINRGKGYTMYLLTAGIGNQNNVRITVTQSETYRVFGSTEFTNMTSVEPVLTEAYKIESDNLKEIKYGGRSIQPTSASLEIKSSSVKRISLPISTISGQMIIHSDTRYGQALHTLDINNSGFYGTWTNLKNLKTLNISSVNANGSIQISGCPLVGENCTISGTSEKPTTLLGLTLTGVKGKFKLENTKIKTIDLSAIPNEDAEFEINGDTELTSLTLTRFKSIIIRGCPRLNQLMILDPDDNKVCESIIIEIPEYTPTDGSTIDGLTKFNSTEDVHGVFDFTKYSKLKTLGLSGCKNVVVIKIPNKTVEIDTFKENSNLEFIDTTGPDSCIMLTKDSTFYKSPRYAMKQSWAVNEEETFNNKYMDPGHGNQSIPLDVVYKCNKRTKMCIKPVVDGVGCTTLANTFFKQNREDTSRYTSNNPYINVWNQKVYNPSITMDDAVWFINDVVEGKPLDDAYLLEEMDGTEIIGIKIIDNQTQPGRPFGSDCSGKITSLQGCFHSQYSIFYDGDLETPVPNLTKYTSLNNINSMYLNTNIKHISSTLLSLYDGNNNNNPENELYWTDFVKTEKIYSDALKHISYRISELTSYYTVYDPSDKTIINSGAKVMDGGEVVRFNVVDLLCPREGELFTRITSINYFSINSDQWVDYSHLLEFCPRVENIDGFLNGVDLSKAKLDGILKTCKNLKRVTNSFNHTGSFDDDVEYPLPSVDLYEFFNWADVDSVTDNLFGIDELFSSGTTTNKDVPGFAIKKHISQENFAKIMGSLHKYTRIKKLSNIFSYCTIDDYDPNYEIKLSGRMEGVLNINFLFYKCKDGSINSYPLKIRRSFFENLPNVTSLVSTFNGVVFDCMLTYDFFCKRKLSNPVNVYVKVDGEMPSSPNAKLYTYEYNRNQSDLYGCFMNAKFKKCKTWFDVADNPSSLIPSKDIIKKIGTDGDTDFDFNVDTYYRRTEDSYTEYKLSESVAYTDTLNNFTNYVDHITITSGGTTIYNHNIFGRDNSSDFDNYGTNDFGKPYVENNFNIYPAYCCLPPDILYGCDYNCDLQYVFANTNIIGVLPQHLLGTRVISKLDNMFMNVNILPNLIYHYNSKDVGNNQYLSLIENIPVDNDTVMQGETTYTLDNDAGEVVLFRNNNGELRRRKRVTSPSSNVDYSKSQFVYVPQGFTVNRYLDSAFTFRYNLPQQINLSRQSMIQEYGIVWPSGTEFGEEYGPETHPELWPYYVQYFFTTEESVSWRNVTQMRTPFIQDGMDVDYKTGEVRSLTVPENVYKNYWWGDIMGSMTKDVWHTKTGGLLNTFLNICGSRDPRTGLFKDCGAKISESIDARNTPKLESFVSGILVIFLNGMIFDVGVDGARFTQDNASRIISYDKGFGRNIILPAIRDSISDSDVRKVLIFYPSTSDTTILYKFMFPNDGTTLGRYGSLYGLKLESNNGQIRESLKYKIT